MIHKLKEFVEDELDKTLEKFDNTEDWDWDCLERLSGIIGAYTDVLEEIDRMNTEEMIRSESWTLEKDKIMTERNNIARVNNSEEAEDYFVHWGYGEFALDKEDIEHLLKGKWIVIHDGEYSHGIHLEKQTNKIDLEELEKRKRLITLEERIRALELRLDTTEVILDNIVAK